MRMNENAREIFFLMYRPDVITITRNHSKKFSNSQDFYDKLCENGMSQIFTGNCLYNSEIIHL